MFRNFIYKNRVQLAGVLMLFMIAGVFYKMQNLDIQTNVIAPNKPKAFDGTTYPVLKIPNWVKLKTEDWKKSYDEITDLVNFPQYDPEKLKKPLNTLGSTDEDNSLRNAKVTFSVVYMASYILETNSTSDSISNSHNELSGSHLAVDIKVPKGTPVYAIANGTVVKASLQSTGFGHHIVIKHENVPSFDNPNILTTYYSSYSHLEDVLVTEGQVIDKGQLIAKSGQTGTATTPHVHFQIDKDSAPWHPYWPFTAQEASAAGYDFSSAVTAGLGRDKALQNTINPLLYVQKYKNGYSAGNPVVSNQTNSGQNSNFYNSTNSSQNLTQLPPVVNDGSVQSSTGSVTIKQASTQFPKNNNQVALPPVENSQTNTENLNHSGEILDQNTVQSSNPTQVSQFKLDYGRTFTVNSTENVTITALDAKGDTVLDPQFQNEVSIRIENGSAILSKAYLKNNDFVNGIAKISFIPTADFGIRFSVTSGYIQTMSDFIQSSLFKDVASSENYYTALGFLKENNIIRGYPDGTFQPNNVVSRVEALKFIYEGLKKPLKTNISLTFKDTDSKAWYARYIATAYTEQVVKGFPNSLFKPSNSVTKAEFLKMLFEAAKIDIPDSDAQVESFEDINSSDWFAEYVGYAKSKNIIDTSSNLFNPNKGMTRAEVAETLYRTIALMVNKKPSYSPSLVVDNGAFNNFFKN